MQRRQRARNFVQEMDLDDPDAHFDVMQEEMLEFKDAFFDGNKERMAEELADVAITVEVMAVLLDIDLPVAFHKKMDYNMKKSGAKDENGKVIDDVVNND